MYLWLKLLHVVAVILFLGNITTGLFWHAHAAKTRDARLLEHTMAGIIKSDLVFTIPGVMLIIATGLLTAMNGGMPIMRTPWIMWSLGLFALSGIVFVTRVGPLQVKLREFAKAGAASGSFDWEGYRRLARSWELWGALALITPIGALILMVLKPAL